jgi:serine/threonine protein kinase
MTEQFCLACLLPIQHPDRCPACGWVRGALAEDPLYLAPGTVIQAPYQVARVLGYGGFGITYLGWDSNLEIRVAIKEYLPRDFSSRDPRNGQVFVLNPSVESTFNAGLNGFLSEARTLAKFQQHPGIVSVLSYFRANGTGYMVMEYVEGETLKNFMIKRSLRMNWDQTLEVFMQVMDAMRMVHAAGILHRDIAPDNIYLCGDGRIKLLDFGAAKQTLSASAQNFSVVVKPGFAADEQYYENGEQGPWTDVYGIAASMYYCLTGNVPPPAPDRREHDTLVLPGQLGFKIPPLAERALSIALSPNARERQTSVTTLQQQLTGEVSISSGAAKKKSTSAGKERSESPLSTSVLDNYNDDETSPLAWLRWLWIGTALIFVLIFVHRTWFSGATNVSSEAQSPQNGGAPTQPEDSQPKLSEQQRRQEQEQLEQFRQQQAEAMRRIDARSQNVPNSGLDPSAEHKRTLCNEWSKAGDCR